MNLYQQVNKAHEEWITATVLAFATPPIKGEITAGKLKWRGIRLCSQEGSPDYSKKWIEQRGKLIGDYFIISNKFF